MADQQLRDFGRSVGSWFKSFPSNFPRYVTERLPIIKWLPRYQRGWAVRDIIAGVTVGLIVVPQGMSYAKVAGLPVQHGLYSAYIGAIFYCFMGTSKDLTIGPTAVISLVTGELVADLAGKMTPPEVAAMSCLIVGVFTMLLGVLRLGIILDFFPTTVLVGYTTGAAATIVIQQIPKWLGVPGINNRAPVYNIIITMFQAIKTLSWLDLVFGLVAMFILVSIGLAVDRWGRGRFSIQLIKISRFFFVTVLATALSYAVNKDAPLDSKGQRIFRLSILKTVPSGLPPPAAGSLPADLVSEVAPKLAAIALATILEHIAIGKAFARRNRYQIDSNQELLTLGLANVTASFFGAYAVTGSFSRSAVKFQCGVKTPFAGFITGALVLLAIFFLTPLFFYIPDAALSAVIMVAVSTLISPPSVFYQFFKINLWDFLSSQVALWVTIFVSVETGIAAGVGFSLIVLLFRVARPNFHVLRQLKDRPDVFIDASVDRTLDTVPAPHGILVFRIEESTTFPNTETFKTWVVDETYKYTRFGGKVKSATERQWSDDLEIHIHELRKIAHGAESNITDDDLPRLRAVVLDFSAVNNIDSTGLQGLFDLREILKDYAGVADYPEFFFELHFVGIQANVLRILELSGITRPVGPIALQKVQVLEHDDGSNVNSASPLSRSSTNNNGGEIRLQDVDSDDSSEIRKEDEDSKGGNFKVESAKVRPAPGDIGAAALSVNGLGSSPFLKEEGLVHLTVRDAIDSILVRSSQWEGGASVEEEERRSTHDKTDIHYV
ncbi:sulfate transporter family-domain-containing protein [Linnemannia elongata]|nr:sulfate transporter family-domain-containing protein [Linnemannia elongata]